MEIVLIKTEDERVFAHLDPYGFIEKIDLPGAFGLGMIMAGKNADIAAGLLVATCEVDRLVIEWLATDPECQGQGVAGALLKKAFLAAQGLGVREVAASLTDRMTDPAFGRDPRQYFRDFFFDIEEEGPDYLVQPVAYISKSRDLANKTKPVDIRSLSGLGATEKNQLIAFMSDCEDAYVIPQYMGNLSAMDPALSFVAMVDEKVSGAFLTISSGRYHYPVFLGATSDHTAFSLEHAVADASEELHLADEFYIRDLGEFTPFMLRGTGNATRVSTLLIKAEVADFTEYAKSR